MITSTEMEISSGGTLNLFTRVSKLLCRDALSSSLSLNTAAYNTLSTLSKVYKHALRGDDGDVKILHNHVYVILAWQVDRDQAKQHLCWTIVMCSNVGLESVQHIVVDLALLSLGVAGTGQVVRHVVGHQRR